MSTNARDDHYKDTWSKDVIPLSLNLICATIDPNGDVYAFKSNCTFPQTYSLYCFNGKNGESKWSTKFGQNAREVDLQIYITSEYVYTMLSKNEIISFKKQNPSVKRTFSLSHLNGVEHVYITPSSTCFIVAKEESQKNGILMIYEIIDDHMQLTKSCTNLENGKGPLRFKNAGEYLMVKSSASSLCNFYDNNGNKMEMECDLTRSTFRHTSRWGNAGRYFLFDRKIQEKEEEEEDEYMLICKRFDGDIVWSREIYTAKLVAKPVFHGDFIYFLTSDHTLTAINLHTGVVRWRTSIERDRDSLVIKCITDIIVSANGNYLCGIQSNLCLVQMFDIKTGIPREQNEAKIGRIIKFVGSVENDVYIIGVCF